LFPPFLGNDEIFHWFRAQQLSSATLFADELGPNSWGGPINASAFMFANETLLSQPGVPLRTFWVRAAALVPASPEMVVIPFPSTASFPPVAHFPQGFGIAVSRALDGNLMVQLWAGRLANLLTYVLVIAAIVRIAPFIAIPVLLVAFFPTALQSAASLSADPMNLTLPALLTAL
ncbi:MAG: DUF2142 domain-containing protein, partial [Alphaproteobacteria bacterium]|nr:DUF2142 domain-containing protein [Alphaproteobacteria bacterium]